MPWAGVVPFVVGFASGLLTSYIVALFNLRNSELTERVNDLCRDIALAADKATEYWLLKHNDPKVPGLEAQLSGLQARVTEMVGQLGSSYFEIPAYVDDHLFDFSDALTGGEFQVRFRAKDPGRASKVQIAASRLMNELRLARRSLIKFRP